MITLAALTLEHLPQAFLWRNDPKIWRWTRQSDFLKWDDHLAWFRSLAGDSSRRMYSVCSDNEPIGVCGFTSINNINRTAEFSLYIAPDMHGKGLGRASLGVLFDHGFASLNLRQIWGESLDGNPAIEMFKGMGMKFDGTRRQFYYKAGAYHDAHLFSILRDEWISTPR